MFDGGLVVKISHVWRSHAFLSLGEGASDREMSGTACRGGWGLTHVIIERVHMKGRTSMAIEHPADGVWTSSRTLLTACNEKAIGSQEA
jgi:hypothetical protein